MTGIRDYITCGVVGSDERVCEGLPVILGDAGIRTSAYSEVQGLKEAFGEGFLHAYNANPFRVPFGPCRPDLLIIDVGAEAEGLGGMLEFSANILGAEQEETAACTSDRAGV